MENWLPMNKNVVGIILIVAALGLVGFYAYPKLKLYFGTPATPAGVGGMVADEPPPAKKPTP